jgi:SAM-dependent methyltransferase
MKYLEADEYLRQRIEPAPGDQDYLHLSDLLTAVKKFIPRKVSRVLDYGCGGSPYRSLFGECTYHRADMADMAGGDKLDFEYGSDSRLPAAATGYDCIVSTQVLEHVEDPLFYLQECYRALEPGGHLLLTTHGMFKDHAVPYDYWRWTIFGLRCLVEKAGFEVVELNKLTLGPRAVLYLLEGQLGSLNFSGSGFYDRLLSYGVRIIRRLGSRRLHHVVDRNFPSHRIANANEFPDDIYICIAVLARR